MEKPHENKNILFYVILFHFHFDTIESVLPVITSFHIGKALPVYMSIIASGICSCRIQKNNTKSREDEGLDSKNCKRNQ